MATKDVKVLNATNAEMLNAIRLNSSLAYQQRVPAADQGDITSTIENLFNYRPAMNEFLDGLVNRIGDVVIKSKIWDNPLRIFKRGLMQYGDTIEEIATELLKAKRYDPNKCYDDVFKCSNPNVMVNFHTINRQDRYDLTINDTMLRRAFLSDYGLQDLVGRLMETPYTSDYWDEYLIMRNLFAELNRADGLYKVNVPDPTTATTRSQRSDVAATITEYVRAKAGKLKFISTEFNSAGVPTFTRADELVLFATPEFIAMLDVNIIAFAFNVSAADLQMRVIEIDDFGIDGCQAILADENIFLCADTLIDFESIRNPKGLSWNYFLHHHGIYSMSRFVNAIMFTTEAGTTVTKPEIATTTVSVDYAEIDGAKPEFAAKGAKTRFIATVDGVVTPETPGYIVPQGVVWTISASDKPLKQATYIDAEGVLHVAENEGATNVTISATATVATASGTYPNKTLVVGIGAKYVG